MRRLLGASISQFWLKIIAAFCMICYIVSKTILQRGVLDIAQYNGESLLAAMAGGSQVMGLATLAIFMQLLAGVSLTIYTFLLVEGFLNTEKFSGYLINLFVFSVIAEVPYNYAFFGRYWDFESQNPMFAMVIGLVVLYIFRYVQRDHAKHVVFCTLITIAGMIWCYLLHIEFGIIAVLMVAIYYLFRNSHGLRLFLGFVAGLPYITGFFAIYPLFIYSGKRGPAYNKYIFYALYPLALLICALITMQI